jgi:hypothetical protein
VQEGKRSKWQIGMKVNKAFIKPETLDMKSINIWLQSIGEPPKTPNKIFTLRIQKKNDIKFAD